MSLVNNSPLRVHLYVVFADLVTGCVYKVQAMFKVLHKTPPIPETLSSEGKDFLQQCFQRNPADRPSAAKLLEHPFVQNMLEQDQDVFVPPKLYPKPLSPVVMVIVPVLLIIIDHMI